MVRSLFISPLENAAPELVARCQIQSSTEFDQHPGGVRVFIEKLGYGFAQPALQIHRIEFLIQLHTMKVLSDRRLSFLVDMFLRSPCD